MNLIKPQKLKYGDTIEFVATSGNIQNQNEVLEAKKYFETQGFKVVLAENIFENDRYLAGEDKSRVHELHKAFLDPNVKAIIAVRGGYGALRIVEQLDFELIKNNPKIFAGFSDITALSAMILKKSNLLTYSAPMAISDFSQNVSSISEKYFFKALMNDEDLIYEPKELNIYKEGKTSGITFGGNLSTIVSLCGIDFIPKEDFIFFTEDLNEPVYKIDKMFTQLLNIPEFRLRLKGIIVGEFLDIDNKSWLDLLFRELGKELDIPVLGDFKITHRKDKLTIPFGAMSEIKDNKFFIYN